MHTSSHTTRKTTTTMASIILLISIHLATILFCSPFALGNVLPPLNGEPHYAYVQMQMVEISKIDGVEQAFHADFYMLTTWAAPLAGTPFNGTESLSTSDLATYFWNPQLEFINERDAVTKMAEEPYSFAQKLEFNVTEINPGYVLPPGWVWIVEDQRYIGDFTTDLGMQDFPFDTQYMQFFLESFTWTYDEVRIRWAIPDAISKLVPAHLRIVGWNWITSEQEETPAPGIYYDYSRRAFPRLTVRAQLERQPQYYLMKIVAGSAMLVYMNIWLFTIAVDSTDRQTGSVAIFGGLVTFLFVASGDTPKVPYQTRLDVFMLWSFFNVAFMMIIHALLYYWRECDVEDLLEERERAKLEKDEKGGENGNGKSSKTLDVALTINDEHPHASSGVEMGRVASPSGFGGIGDPTVNYATRTRAGGITGEIRVPQKGPIAYMPIQHVHHTTWRLREDDWRDFTVRKWFAGLHATRKWDAILMPVMFIVYSIGIAIILGRPISTPSKD